jgi:diguanylate cyclase (GGDEF)-like protein
MQWNSVPCLAMCSLTLYVGGYHCATYLKRPQARAHLPFALLCLSVSVYDALCVGLYNSTSLAEGVEWQRLQLPAIACISVLVAWFVGIVTGNYQPRFLRAVTVWYAALVALAYALPVSLTLDTSHPAIKQVGLLGFPEVTYYEAELGPIFTITVASSVLVYCYVARMLLRRHFAHSDASTLGMIVSQGAYFAGVVNDSMVAGGVYQFIYLSEYAFLVVVLAMAHVLLCEFVDVHARLQQLNDNLEAKVTERTHEISQLNEDLRRLVDFDPLTGAHNRRFLDRYLEIETRRLDSILTYDAETREQEAFGLALIDLDNFKSINDRLGHAAGDRALVQFADTVRSAMFSRDVFCRYGGEEFVIIFTHTTPEGVIQAAEKIRRSVASRVFSLTGPDSAHRVTVSVGVAFFGERQESSAQDMLRIADERLLIAKRTGKNRVVSGGDLQAPTSLGVPSLRSRSLRAPRPSAPSDPG